MAGTQGERGRSGEAQFTEATRAGSAAAHAQRDGFVDQEEAVKGGTAHGALGVAAQGVARRASRGVHAMTRPVLKTAFTSQSSPNNRTAGTQRAGWHTQPAGHSHLLLTNFLAHWLHRLRWPQGMHTAGTSTGGRMWGLRNLGSSPKGQGNDQMASKFAECQGGFAQRKGQACNNPHHSRALRCTATHATQRAPVDPSTATEQSACQRRHSRALRSASKHTTHSSSSSSTSAPPPREAALALALMLGSDCSEKAVGQHVA